MEQCCDHQPTKMESQNNNLVNLVGYISLTHATALHPIKYSCLQCILAADTTLKPQMYYYTCTLLYLLELPAIKSMQLLFKGNTSSQSEVSYLNNKQNRDGLCQARNVSCFPLHCYSLHVNHKKMNT